jgi:5-methyltetrahydrofolate--homocysteine methyltransferase
MADLAQIAAALLAGEDEQVAELTAQALAAGRAAEQILNEGLLAGMQVVGERFRCHELFLPDVLMAARAMYAGLDLLKPLLAEAGVPMRGKVVLGTVAGDLHDIGKNLVAIMLGGAGYQVIDLGKDVPAARFVETAHREGARVIGMSALLTTTMPAMGQVVGLLKEQGLQDQIRTVIGGAPVTAEFARRIGADAYAYDAAHAVEQISKLMA